MNYRQHTWIDPHNAVRFAIACAEAVLPIWEAQYPDDDRPKKAIDAADAARAAARAADAAADAARAAADAADAAADAARAAADAAYAAADAADAADTDISIPRLYATWVAIDLSINNVDAVFAMLVAEEPATLLQETQS